MTAIVKVGEAKTDLSDLLARVEAGEEITIARGDVPIAKLTRIEKANDLAAVLAEARAARARTKSVTREEILAWKRAGARGHDRRGRRLDRGLLPRNEACLSRHWMESSLKRRAGKASRCSGRSKLRMIRRFLA
jgi:antitoxin (DNA-binding transcriptional repressor) of toxin-antitoxin stability system